MFNLELPIVITVLAALILLPGFIAVSVRDAITARRRREIKEIWVPAFLFDVPIYAFLVLLGHAKGFGLTPTLPDGNFNLMTILAALLIALFVGFIVGVTEESGLAQKVLFKSRLSRKGWKTPWASAFRFAETVEETPSWVVVWLKDGTRIFGWPKFYSDDGKDATVFLAAGEVGRELVTVIHPGGTKQIPIRGPGVLIAPGAGITRLEFLEGEERQPEAPLVPQQEEEA